jgi:hypothetical protein
MLKYCRYHGQPKSNQTLQYTREVSMCRRTTFSGYHVACMSCNAPNKTDLEQISRVKGSLKSNPTRRFMRRTVLSSLCQATAPDLRGDN